MKLYSNEGKKLSWLTFTLFVIFVTCGWVVLGGIPAAVAGLIWGAEGATAVYGTWILGVAVLFVVSMTRALRTAAKNNKKFGGVK